MRLPALALPFCLVLAATAGAPPAAAADRDERTPLARPADPDYRAALDLVYDGAFREAEHELARLAAENVEDPVAPYLQALALEWRLEQSPAVRTHDDEVLRLADAALERAGARLARHPDDPRGLLARAAAHGIKSRLHLFRGERRDAAGEAVRMREGLLAARAAGVGAGEVDFGLGLYDYYADVLPRFFRIARFLAGIPGGDRERGLDALARTARGGSLFHDTEARVQMFEIQCYFERRPDGALHWIRGMWRQYPGWPRWGLKLSELLRQELSLYDESAAVAREIVDVAEGGRHVNYQPIVAAMGRVALGEALLGDLRLEAAREAALPAEGGFPAAPWVSPRASLVVARSLELDGRREDALPHYRRAASGADPATAARAREALAHPIPGSFRRATSFLARARRLAEAGRPDDARAQCLDALRAHPAHPEARVCVAEGERRPGDREPARALVLGVADDEDQPLWLRARARLVLAATHEARGETADALRLYNDVWENPAGRPTLREAAAGGIGRLQPARARPPAPRWDR